jgi:hypothetical protein
MSDLFTAIYEMAKPLIDLIIDALPFVLVGLVLAMLVGRAALATLIKIGQRWAGYEEGHRLLAPRTWFKIEPKAHFKIKGEILANGAIRELYAPEARYTRDQRDKERAWKLAWLSPFPKAVKASIADSNTPKGKKLDARKQVKEVARSIEVCHLPEDQPVANGLRKKDAPKGETETEREKRLRRQHSINEANHFRINLATMGKDPAVIERIEKNLLTQLNLKGGIMKLDQNDPTIVAYLAHKEIPVDPLTEGITVEYLDEHRAKIVYELVLGIDKAGKPLIYKLHHTLILGASGAGKGSPIQSIIWQLAPFVKSGICEFHAVDPKRAEFALYAKFPSKLFKRISLGSSDEDMRDHAETIAHLLQIINRRALNAPLSITEGEVEDGRNFEASEDNPVIVFFIDEFPSLFEGFKKLGRDGVVPLSELEQVISMGRSFGVYVVLATQRSEMSRLEAVRPNIAVPIILRQPSDHMNDLFLGKGAMAAGYDSTAIPMSTKPHYETAGTGYTLNEMGRPVKGRFAFVSREDIGRLIREFRDLDENEFRLAVQEEEARELSDDPLDDGDFAITDQGEELPELETFELDDFDDFEKPWPRG